MSSSAESQHPRVLLMGTRRGGKSSIQNVVFHRMSPHETLFLESTNRTIKHDIASSSFLRFEVWDFPGHLDTASAAINPELTYGSGCGALVWVIDAQSDYYEALSRLQATIAVAHRINPAIVFEVFLHKVDNPNPKPKPNLTLPQTLPLILHKVDLFTEDQRVECQRDVQSHLADEMETACLGQVKINFHLTSIYDHSVFEAFSKVAQHLPPTPNSDPTPLPPPPPTPSPHPWPLTPGPWPLTPLPGGPAARCAAAILREAARYPRHRMPHREGIPTYE